MRKLFTLIPLALIFSCVVLAQKNFSASPSTTWFSPELVENNSSLCEGFLDVMTPRLDSSEPELSDIGLQRVFLNDLQLDVPAEEISGRVTWDDKPYLISYDTKYYIYELEGIGCGGGCNQYSYVASLVPFTGDRNEHLASSFIEGSLTPSTSRSVVLLRTEDNKYYVSSDIGSHQDLHHLNQEAEWELSCKVKMQPDVFANEDYPSVAGVKEAMDEFHDVVRDIVGWPGCSQGSLQANSRRDRSVSERLGELLYQPMLENNVRAARSYENVITYMRRWALAGISEQSTILRYESELEQMVGLLSNLYIEQFGFTQEEARRTAHLGLTSVVASNFAYASPYTPYRNPDEEALRTAILENRPIEEIRQFVVPASLIDRSANPDSMLNIALEYPQALEYLLELGGNPNQPNRFGKTPLMYAAQYNALDAAKILLQAGAEPDATTIGLRNCDYALSTSAMTPLHYAVRYASTEFVDLLLDAGANTYTSTFSSLEGRDGEYAIDWLDHYASENSEEPNLNISADEYVYLQNRLAIPSEAVRMEEAREHTEQAKQSYENGDAERAYTSIQQALQADPLHTEALALNITVASLLGDTEQAASAANTIIDLDRDSEVVANAWSSLGSMCERRSNRLEDYDENSLCTYSYLFYFYQAWKSNPVDRHGKKLEEAFSERYSGNCEFSNDPVYHYFIAQRRGDYLDRQASPLDYSNFIYLLHDADWHPSDKTVEVQNREDHTWISPELIDRSDIGEYAISVFRQEHYISAARFEDSDCSAYMHR